MSQMRWFTDEAYDMDDAEWEAMLTAYQAHVAEIASALPEDLAALASDPKLHLHDARIRRIVVNQVAHVVVMTMDLINDRGLVLTLGGANFVPDNLQAVAYAVGATYSTDHWGTARTAVLAQEIDIAGDNRYLLRLRLWPFGEFGLEFGSFSLEVTSAPADDERPGEFLFADAEPAQG